MSTGRDRSINPFSEQVGAHDDADPERIHFFPQSLAYARGMAPTSYHGGIPQHPSRNHHTPYSGPTHQPPPIFNIYQAQSARMGLDAFDLQLHNPSPPLLGRSSLQGNTVPPTIEVPASSSRYQLLNISNDRPSPDPSSLSRHPSFGHSHPEQPLAPPASGHEYQVTLFNRQLPTPETSSSGLHFQSLRQRVLQPHGLNEQHSHATSVPHFENQYALNSSSSPAVSSPTTRLSKRPHGHPVMSVHTSQEVARPAQPSTPPSQTEQTVRHLDLGHAPPIANGVHLISPRDVLPDRLRVVFPFELFNAVQSKSFASVYKTNDNVVVSAPTGSGKTAIFELAICKLLSQNTDQNFKVIYVAPTKALCSERARDWESKFRHLNLTSAELTGDTFSTDMSRVRAAQIIVTTPEKLDSITRRWEDYRKLLDLVQLVLIDEVHFLKDTRGATLEVLICRMKTQVSNIRVVALSATVPNSEDVAKWLGRGNTDNHQPARLETFGEEFRPVRLQKHVYGLHCSGNAFQFEPQLDTKLCEVITTHSQKKPIIVFCFTRKSCELTAKKLSQLWISMADDKKPWPGPGQNMKVTNDGLQQVMQQGVAFHHAGLEQQDRLAVEKAYLEGKLHVICCTSTLSVGVNLPCHTVILKGTMGFQDGKLLEYSDLEVVQMLGRAGRPQFDNSAVAIILTRSETKARYEAMASGTQVLESTLHHNLIHHLNSEICLGTIRSLDSAKEWLKSTFLGVRLHANPSHYKIDSQSPNGEKLHVGRSIDDMCEREINLLQEAKLIRFDNNVLECTTAGRSMSEYMIRFETMKMILDMPTGTKIHDILMTLAKAEEFKDLRIKSNERALYRTLNESPFIRYQVRAKDITEAWHKVFIIVQLDLGGGDFPSPKSDTSSSVSKNHFNITKRQVSDRMKWLLRCVIDCKGAERDSETVNNALELLRSINAGGWEGLPSQLLQVPGIGPVSMRKLTTHGITNMASLREADYMAIENILTRKPPFGKNLMDTMKTFPKLGLELSLSEASNSSHASEDDLSVVKLEAKLTFEGLDSGNPSPGGKVEYLTFLAETSEKRLVYFWRGRDWKGRADRAKLIFSATLSSGETEISCHFHYEGLVGLGVSKTAHRTVPKPASAKRASQKSLQRMSSVTKPVKNKNSGNDPTSPIEIDEDGLEDEDLIEMLEQVQRTPASRPSKRTGGDDASEDDDDDEFPSVEHIARSTKTTSPERTTHVPVQLPNGRWKCNHTCAEFARTKTGQPCKHNCCHEGLEKKPKPKTRAKIEGNSKKRGLEVEEQVISGARSPVSSTTKSAPITSMPPPKKPKISKAVESQSLQRNPTTATSGKRVQKYMAPTSYQIQRAPVIDLSQEENATSANEAKGNDNGDGPGVVPLQYLPGWRDRSLEDWGQPVHFDFDNFEYPDPRKAAQAAPSPFREGGMDVTLTPEPMLGITASGGISEEDQKKLLEASRILGLRSSPDIVRTDTSEESSLPGSSYKVTDEPESEIYKLGSELDLGQNSIPTPDGHFEDENMEDTIVVANTTNVTEPEWVNEMDSDIMDFFRDSNITFV
ncbi:ATP-dependent DNA helicase MER3 [Pyricularia oryzae]|nr:ATP-dependent DNA helicase MER3 [Pyricularia oryzae]